MTAKDLVLADDEVLRDDVGDGQGLIVSTTSLGVIREGIESLWYAAAERVGRIPPDQAVHETWATMGQEHMLSVASYDEENWRFLLREYRRRFRSPAPNITPVIQELCIDRINGVRDGHKVIREPLVIEAVIEVLEWAADYMTVETAEVAIWIRARAVEELRKRFGRDTAEEMARRYLDRAPPVEAAYDDQGRLLSINLAESRNVKWLVEGMIPQATVGILVAPFGSGKTFAATSLGLSLAFGEDWLRRPTPGGGHVRYVAAEGIASFDKRLAGWLVRHGQLPKEFSRTALAEALKGRFTLSSGSLRLDDPRLEEVLIKTLLEDRTRLLVLDTLGRLLGPEQSDEDNQTANAVMGLLHRVAAATGATILLIHHPGHENTGRARGASAWEQAADFVFTVKGTSEDLRSGKPLVLKNRKQRDAELAPDTSYVLSSVAATCDGEEWSGAVLESAPSPLPEMRLHDRIRAVVLAKPGQTKGAVCSQVEARRKTALAEIDRLLAEGFLENRGTGKAYEIHDVPEKWDPLSPGSVLLPVTASGS